jgi:putative flippase GtrA
MMNIQEKIADPSLMASLSRHPEMELIRAYEGNSLAFFGLFPQNLHFLTPDGVVNYRLANKVAVVLGDPVCAPEAIEKVIESFLDFCARSHWRVAFYQASPAYLSAYHALGLHSFKMGEEAVLNPQTFTLHGSALANVRTSARRAERDGTSIQWFEGVPPTTVMQQLENVSLTWLERKAGKQSSETGFSTGRLDDVIAGATLAENIASLSPSAFPGNAPRFVTAVVTTSAGTACAFVTFTPIYAAPWGEGTCLETLGWGWSLDLMRRTPDAPPGVMELLLVRALERFRSSGAQVVNLGLVALADTCQEMTPGQRYLMSGVFLLILNVLLWCFPTTNALVLVIYNSFAYGGGGITSFFLNKYWTFRQRQRTTRKVVLRFAILLACEILYSNILVWLAGKMLHPLISNPILWGNASKLLAVAGSAILSYAGMRFWAFAGHSRDLPKQEAEPAPLAASKVPEAAQPRS